MAANNFGLDNMSDVGIAANEPANETVSGETSEIEPALPRENYPLQRSSSNDSNQTIIVMGQSKAHVRDLDENNQLSAEEQQQSDRESPKEQSETLVWWKLKLRTVLYIHLIFTMVLLILKVIVAIWSSSMSIRSLVGDSAVDLINLSLLLGASFIAKRNKNKYPLGRTNIETLAILTMAIFMTGMLGGVIFQAGVRLWEKYQYFFSQGRVPEKADISVASASIVGALILIKLILFVVCVINKNAQSKALKKDHQVDMLMNLGALVLGFLGSLGTPGKWTEKMIIIDDIGAICLALYGIYIWVPQIRENVRRACHRIVGDDDSKTTVRSIAAEVLKKILAQNEEVGLGETIICHGGGDKTIIMQMITLPDNINHERVKYIFSELKSALAKSENAGHVIIHWEL